METSDVTRIAECLCTASWTQFSLYSFGAKVQILLSSKDCLWKRRIGFHSVSRAVFRSSYEKAIKLTTFWEKLKVYHLCLSRLASRTILTIFHSDLIVIWHVRPVFCETPRIKHEVGQNFRLVICNMELKELDNVVSWVKHFEWFNQWY